MWSHLTLTLMCRCRPAVLSKDTASLNRIETREAGRSLRQAAHVGLREENSNRVGAEGWVAKRILESGLNMKIPTSSRCRDDIGSGKNRQMLSPRGSVLRSVDFTGDTLTLFSRENTKCRVRYDVPNIKIRRCPYSVAEVVRLGLSSR